MTSKEVLTDTSRHLEPRGGTRRHVTFVLPALPKTWGASGTALDYGAGTRHRLDLPFDADTAAAIRTEVKRLIEDLLQRKFGSPVDATSRGTLDLVRMQAESWATRSAKLERDEIVPESHQ